jgi:hypothetical protein
MRKLLHDLTLKVFIFLSVRLGIEGGRQETEWHYRQLEAKLLEIQEQINAMQVDRLKVYVNEKPKIMMQMDYESSQVAALEEFKEQ